jgi:hypothetical protein
VDFDVLLVADPRFPGGTSTAVAHEARALAKAGYSVGLLPVASPILSARRGPHPEIAALTEAGVLIAVPPEARVWARLACIHHPTALQDRPTGVWRATAAETVIVAHHPPINAAGTTQYDIPRITEVVGELFGAAAWAPVGPAARAAFAGIADAPGLTPDDWVNVLDPDDFAGPRMGPLSALAVVGRHSRPDPAKWPDTREGFLAAYPDAPDIQVRLMGYFAALDAVVAPRPAGWQVLPFGAMPVHRFLTSIDYFSYYHGSAWIEAFGRAPLEAMAAGLPCLLPPSFAALFEEGAIYGPADSVAETVRRLHADPVAYALQSARAVRVVQDRYGPARAVARVAARIGPSGRRPARSPGPGKAEACVLYVTSNGIGMGHLTRCLASARRLPATVRPVVLTMSKAFGVVRDQGIAAGYLPYFRSVGLPEEEWNASLEAEIDEALGFWRPNVAVFDGNVPYPGMLSALARHPAVWSVWQRRGLWRHGSGEGALARQGCFDMVIEPGELAAAFDDGPTAALRKDALVVPPVTFLRADEALAPGAARAAVGLDPSRPAVLLQLGSGNNFDIGAPLGQIFEALRALPDGRRPQIVNADWRISQTSLQLPPDVARLSSFPFARYLAAFDWAIAAAGYNTFHENLAAHLPTLFLSNENPEHDMQSVRADYGAMRGLCRSARPDDTQAIRRGIAELCDPDARRMIAVACARLVRTNGADEVARYLGNLAFLRKPIKDKKRAPPPVDSPAIGSQPTMTP